MHVHGGHMNTCIRRNELEAVAWPFGRRFPGDGRDMLALKSVKRYCSTLAASLYISALSLDTTVITRKA